MLLPSSTPTVSIPTAPGAAGQGLAAKEGSPTADSSAAAMEGHATQQPDAGVKPDDDLSARFAALSRKEHKFQEDKRKAKELSEKYSPFEEAITQKDALKLLERAGFSINDVIDAALKVDHVPTSDEKVATLEQKLAAFEKAQLDAATAKEQSAQQEVFDREVSAFKETLGKTLASDPDRFELINSHGAADTIYDACFEIVQDDPDSYETRAEVEALIPRVADMIEAQLQKNLEKLSGAKKFKALLGLTEATPGVGLNSGTRLAAPTQASLYSPAQASSQQDITLTNRNAASPAQPEAKPRAMTRDESKAQVAKWLEEQMRLKSQQPKPRA